MKFQKNLLILRNKNLILFAVIVFGCMLLKSYAHQNTDVKGDFSYNPSATITSETNVTCEREFVVITFEGSGGIAPYTFTYTANGGEAQTITSNDLGIAEINFREVFAGTFNYKLTSVTDADSQVTQITDQEVSILVNALPEVSFTFDKNNVCAGELITFTPQVSGAGGFKYLWTYEDGVTSELENPSHSVEALGCSTEDQTFRVTLKVTDKNGCVNSVVNFVTVTPKPDLEFFDIDENDFNNCDNASIANPNFTVNVGNKSKSPCVDSYAIDWGDGTTEDSIEFPIAHTYTELGIFTMKVRGLGENGCFSELEYQVINISHPVGNLTNLVPTNNVCLADAEMEFEITDWETNWPETLYTIDFGDGSDTKTYTHADLQNNNKFNHVYLNGSCTEPNGEFIATLTIENVCSTTERTLNNIKILEPSIAEFEAQEIACINSDVTFTNTSFIGENDECNKVANFTWDFGDGTIKNDTNASTANNQTHQYTTSGTYTVTLTVDTKCNTDVFTKVICIEEVNTPTFDTNEDAGCIPLNIAVTNTTTVNTVCSTASYEWEVAYAATNCETVGSWTFTNGTDKNSENPQFLFTNAGLYTLTQKIITGCGIETNSKEIEVKKPSTVSIDPITNGCDNLTINPLANIQHCTSNTTDVTYNWTFTGGNPSTANTLDPGNIVYDTPGTYEVTLEVTTDCGVSNLATQTFEVLEKPLVTNTNLTQEICSNQNTTAIDLTSNIANTTYSWSAVASDGISGFIANGTTNVIPSQMFINSQNTSGEVTYTIIPSNNGCVGDAVAFVVTVNPAPRITSQPLSSEVCQGSEANPLEVAFENGTGTATYQWFSNTTDINSDGNLISGATSSTYNPPTDNVGALFYYVEISFSAGACVEIVSNTALVNVLAQPIINPIESAQNYCIDDASTPLQATYSGAEGVEVTYQWFSNTTNSNTSGNPIDAETSNTFSPPTNAVGTSYYYVEISFSSGDCNTIISNTASVVVNETPIIADAAITTNSNEAFTFNPNSVSGNTLPNNTLYTWTAPSFSPSGAIIGASAAATPQQFINQTLENTTSSPIKVTYLITPATANCTGNPFVLEVTVLANISANAIVLPASCFESNDGAITTNISGGVPFDAGSPYQVSWSGPNGFSSSEASIANLTAGQYIITIKDKDGNTAIEEFAVTQPDNLEITKDLEKNVSCFNGNDGILEVTINGGTMPYTYNWTTTNGSGIVANQKNQNTLTKGNYTLEVIDKNNCVTSTSFVITEPEEIEITLLDKKDIVCFGDAEGALEVAVSGGVKTAISSGVFDYVYTWSGPNGFTSSSKNIDNLIAGNYTLLVTDDLGCTANASFTVNQTNQITIDVVKTDESCYQENDGSIEVTLTGGTAPYTFTWSNGATGLSQSNLAPDTYTIIVTDANNCTEQASIVINDAIFYIEPTTTPITCNAANDAAINLNLTGGVEPISIVWSDGATDVTERTNLAAGSYTVTLTDSNPTQCPIEETFVISSPSPIVVTETIIDATDCAIENSGSINLEVSGGVAPYSFLWNTNETSEDLNAIRAGVYSVQITDAVGCIFTEQYTIFRQEPLDVLVDEVILEDCDLRKTSKQLTAIASGGFSPYTYVWSSGTISGEDNNIMITSTNDMYSITITDSAGCSIQKSFNVDVPTIGTTDFNYSSFAFDNYNLLSIQDPIQFTNLSTGDIRGITWNFGDGSPTVNDENPVYTYAKEGFYTITYTVQYEAGCTYTLERNINITKGYILITPNSFTPNGDGINERMKPVHEGFSEIEITIYTSWGTRVYYEKSLNLMGWDGFIKGLPAENGNYVIVVKGLTFYKGEIMESIPFTLIK
ncbi:PKD domain-containing protein [Polaribacter sp. Hel_I_88]|uniref:PKD domain-containing protein n=1 Tax=Polaribacter sp. Hel_I_88 TaxID=1250006 RepID=UPI0009E08B39|nr:PKD domain-containing protein [Polaribacter sp. Hel_I_88]